MTATSFTATPDTAPTPVSVASQSTTTTRVWRTSLVAGLAAAAATSGVAGLARAADVPLTVSGSAIPVIGFAEVTFVAAMIGTLIAAVLRRRASRPRHTFLVTTIALTLLSFLPDVFADAHTATKVTLVLTHMVAAAVVIPALAGRLAD